MAIVALARPKIRAVSLPPKLGGGSQHNVRVSRVLSAARSSKASSAKAFSAEEAWQWLLEYSKLDFQGRAQHLRDSKSQRDILREALQSVIAVPNPAAGWSPESPQVLIGLVSSDVRIAVRALRDWAHTFNADYIVPEVRVTACSNIAQVSGAVFVKYNLQSKVCYLSQYQGQDRGVLITLGTQQFGHFPLGLFDESMEQPAPSLPVTL